MAWYKLVLTLFLVLNVIIMKPEYNIIQLQIVREILKHKRELGNRRL
jgi:hypothetical protein